MLQHGDIVVLRGLVDQLDAGEESYLLQGVIMLEALLLHLLAIPVFAWQLLRAVPAEGWRHVWKRIPLFGLIWILFSLLNLLHIIGHLADEVLFRNYRRTAIREPVFIIGIPRSGTTFLQRLLGCEQKFTTFLYLGGNFRTVDLRKIFLPRPWLVDAPFQFNIQTYSSKSLPADGHYS